MKAINLSREITAYLIIGFFTELVTLFVYYFSTALFLNPENPLELQLANVLSWLVAVIFAYFMNRGFVFRSSNPRVFFESISFIGSRVGTLLLNMFLMYMLVTSLNYNDKVMKVLVEVIVVITNYLTGKFLVFRVGQYKKNR